MDNKQKHKRYMFLKKELEKNMPSVIKAISVGFYPANYKKLENMAQEFFQLKKELKLIR